MKKFIKKIFIPIFNFFKPAHYRFKSFWGRYKFQTILICLIVFALFIFIKYMQKQNETYNFYDELDYRGNPFYIVNIAIVLAAIGTAIFTWWKNTINQKLSETQESIRQDDLYAKAVEYLKSTNDLITRKGGVHILKDLAMTSPKHAQKCIDMLCSLNETWMPKFLKDYPDFFKINNNFANIKNIEEVKIYNGGVNVIDSSEYLAYNIYTKPIVNDIMLSQLVLLSLSEIIKHISKNYEYKEKYDLSYKYLCSINLSELDIRKFNLRNVNLQNSYLKNSYLQKVNLFGANLQSAYLDNVNLQYANLCKANLKLASLNKANLEFADLIDANLQSTALQDAILINSTLFGADLQSANLNHAILQFTNLSAIIEFDSDGKKQSQYVYGANFSNARLYKTDFRNAKNFDGATFNGNNSDAILDKK